MTVLFVLVTAAAVAAVAAAIFHALRAARAERALDHASALAADAVERRLNVLEAVGDGMYIVDDEMRIIHLNEAAEGLLRVTAGELVGRSLHEIIDPLASELIREIRDARATGVLCEHIQAFPATQSWIEIRIHPAASETIVTLRDVSERTRAQVRLQENEHRLRLVTQHVDAVLWTTDREGRFTTISGGALEQLGLDTGDIVARTSNAFVPRHVLEDVFAGTSARVESAHSEHWLRHHIEPLTGSEHTVVGAVGVSIDITELKRAQGVLVDAAHRDRLTGLPNRLALEGRLAELMGAAARSSDRFTLLFVDLDRFKTINDTLGHAVGDDVLRSVAARLQAVMRPGELVARPGGDEFIILLQQVGDAAAIEAVAKRLIRCLAPAVDVGGRQLYVSASIGAAVFPEHGADAEALIAHADSAMYRAKAMGGNRYAVFESSMEAASFDRLALENELHDAVDANQFELYYQPIVSLTSREIVGCEALIRWNHPVRGLIDPQTFIGIAEETGAIVAIDRWVLREACATVARLRRVIPDFRIAVNVSSRDLHETDLPDAVAAALADFGLAPTALAIEITETVALDDSVLPVLRRLFALGIHIALDDFGIGYSSLSYLKRLPITTLKVDRSFVQDVDTDPYDQAIVGSIVAIARALGFRVVAEGVETDAQLQRIATMGCDDAQGYHFGKAQTFSTLHGLIRQNARQKPAATVRKLLTSAS
ncbi:MAG: hypothetical protein NVS3B7_05790 [Candidatus Elarobacter sp.]